MKIKYQILLFSSSLIFFISCAGIPEESAKVSQYDQIDSEYSLESLLNPIKQLNDLLKYFDYFDQFVYENDYNYSNFLFNFFLLESFNGADGSGSRFVTYADKNQAVLTYDKTLLATEPDGKQWWQISVLYQDRLVFFEILIHELGVPIKLRYVNRDSGDKIEMVPAIGEQFLNELEKITTEEMLSTIALRKKEAKDLERPNLLFEPQIIGEELISTRAGTFQSVHISDSNDRGDKTDYWISPDLPGQILKIEYTGANNINTFYSETIKIWTDRTPLIKEEELADYLFLNSEESYSEGAREDPVFLFPGDEYYGSVGEGETSYYMFYVDGNSQVNINVTNLSGLAELLFYEEDYSFEQWITSNEGDYLSIEQKDVNEGTYLYFSIHDILDEDSDGESYIININQIYNE